MGKRRVSPSSWQPVLRVENGVPHVRSWIPGRGWAAGFRHHFATNGVIYSVADDGALTWRRYDGQGEQDPTGSLVELWAPNSGNQIGQGF